MRVELRISPDGKHVTIKAIDLTGDTWHDYVHYLEEARKSEASNDLHATNRALRAALANLIAHLDGVVTALHEKLRKTRSDFQTRKRRDGKQCTLKDRILDLKKHAKQQMNSHLPYLRLRLKPLRDILVHPSITKTDQDETTDRQIELSELDLFGLSVESLSDEGSHISSWLDRLCAVYSYTRIHDTYSIAKEFTDALGTGPEPRRM